MLKQISNIEIAHSDIFYGQTTYRKTYQSDDIITKDEADELMRTVYHGIPFIEADYSIEDNGHSLVVVYTIDDCE